MAKPRFVPVVEQIRILKESIFNRRFKGMNWFESKRIQNAIVKGVMNNYSLAQTTRALQGINPDLSTRKARSMIGSENQAIKNNLLEASFKINDPKGIKKYQWVGPNFQKGRSTLICVAIKRRTMRGVNIAKLRQIIKEESDKKMYNPVRPYTPHYLCRHSFIKVFR